jgi:hypothetical protein
MDEVSNMTPTTIRLGRGASWMMLWIAGAVALIFIGYLIYDIFRTRQRKRRIEGWRRRAQTQQNLESDRAATKKRVESANDTGKVDTTGD